MKVYIPKRYREEEQGLKDFFIREGLTSVIIMSHNVELQKNRYKTPEEEVIVYQEVMLWQEQFLTDNTIFGVPDLENYILLGDFK